jgi:N-methylhydantoinase A
MSTPHSVTTKRARYRFGFDIGGTFTDFVLIDNSTGDVHTHKVLTTPDAPSRAVMEGWENLLQRLGAHGSEVETAIHATTLITNALLEGKGAKTALVTTEGFRDILELRREMRYDIYDLQITLPNPLVPRYRRFEVRERLDARGHVVTPLDAASASAAIDELLAHEVDACAVSFLHAFTNPMHEIQFREMLAKRAPHLVVSLSSEVAPEIREFERTSTTVANAYVQPLTNSYLHALQQQLHEAGFDRPLYLMLSNGGITTVDTANRFPIRLVESGPAAGALAAVFYGSLVGERDLLSFDMGGTTAKLCLIKDLTPQKSSMFEIGRVHRFKRGSGHPVLVPVIELIEIGAGGGSIARVDDLGLLKVGPESAGANPGPACYGGGGERPTVTDADLVLGYLNPDNFLGGRLTLNVQAARDAIAHHIAEPLGLSVEEAAHGIYQVVNESMISATRVHIAERNADARRMKLVAFGGAGAVHADRIARELKMQGYVCPASAGVASALGFLTAPASFEFSRTQFLELIDAALPRLDELFGELAREGTEVLVSGGVAAEAVRFERRIEVRHRGQGHVIEVPLPDGQLQRIGAENLRQRFFQSYAKVYGHAHEHLVVEITTCRLAAVGPTPRVELARSAQGEGGAERALKGYRRAFFKELGGYADTPIYDRYQLTAATTFEGPAIVEQVDSTAVIGPHTHVTVDSYLNLIVTLHHTPTTDGSR